MMAGIPMVPVRSCIRFCRAFFHYTVATVRLQHMERKHLAFLSDVECVDEIVNFGRSLARFGDGELSWVLGIDVASSYQPVSQQLKERLTEVLIEEDPQLIVGVLKILNGDSGTRLRARMHWRRFRADVGPSIVDLIDQRRVYADSSLTRPYIDVRDRSNARAAFENLKRIWSGRRVLLLEGEFSRLGVGNDLFSGVSSMRRVLCPSSDAFECYEQILEVAKREAGVGDLVLLALGPTATVLAADLTRSGIQAVDIGHVDIEYEWFLRSAKKKTPIEGKMIRESGVEDRSDTGVDAEYFKSIVGRVVSTTP